MRINVTREDIEDGVMGDEFSCAIALACRRMGLRYVSVGAASMRWTTPKGQRFAARLPSDAQEFVELYDDGQPVEPFSFEPTMMVRPL